MIDEKDAFWNYIMETEYDEEENEEEVTNPFLLDEENNINRK